MAKVNRSKSFIIVTLAAFALSSLLFLTSLDNKIFDLFLRVLPSLAENEKVIIVTLDDDSIAYAGGFPFRREVMGDVVILLKELGVQSIVFDLSYLDESPARLDPDYASEVFNRYLNSGFGRLDEALDVIDLIDAKTDRSELDLYKQDFHFLHNTVRNELEDSLSLLIRDVDEYFAQALAFSGCSYLTLTMIRPEEILGDIAANDEIDQYLAENIALDNVINAGDSKTPDMAGVLPAILKLLSRSKGAGFVNASPDSDGLRRRIHLLVKYKGKYYPQLALAALQEKLGYRSVVVTDKAITLTGSSTIIIPRARDGTMLLKWPKKAFYDYRMMSMVELIQHTLIEPAFIQNISMMHESGFFYYWDGGNESELYSSPWEYCLEAEKIKNSAFASASQGSDESWQAARRKFFHSCDIFLNGSYEDAILADVGDDYEIIDLVRDLFGECRSQFNRMTVIRKSAAALQDSFCIIGADATSMTDNGITTFQEHYPNVGTYAVAANMLLAQEFLKDTPRYIPAIIALLYSLLIAFLISRFDTYRSIVTGIAGLAVLTGTFIAFFAISKIYLGLAVPLTATTLTFISLMITKFLTASREKAFLHNAFSRYLAPEVITDIINNPDKLNLGGEKREMTAIFTDIQGFSTISEKLDPVYLVKLLNRYLTAMSNIIMENMGTIDKYEGDAIIAFFGAPLFNADHPALACRSALAMKAAERELNTTVVSEGLSPTPLFTRIGINTGEMVVGNMGAENKMDYTIMGNAVNLAARLEGVNKQYHTGGILISEYTREKIGDEFLVRRLDRVRVVGINTPLRLYELLGTGNEKIDVWERGIDLYEHREFKEAGSLFVSLMKSDPNDKVAALYARRCMECLKSPPPENWDAVNNLTEK